MSARKVPRLRLLGRQDCGLCEQMTVDLLPALEAGHLQLEPQDVDCEAQLQRRYGLRIPVLIDDWDEVVCEGRLDAGALHQWLHEQARRDSR